MNDVPSLIWSGNRLLSSLPESEVASLLPSLKVVSLEVGQILANPGDRIRECYFPTRGMISLLSVTEQGDTVEVAYTGREGMAGLGAVLGNREKLYQMLVQAETECVVVDASAVNALFQTTSVFHDRLLRYVYALLKQMSQTCLCNHFHTIQSRLCRWLTVIFERSGKSELILTQEFLAHMLGVQRTSIGLIASSMQAQGIIRYRRGRVQVVDIETLRQNACECYRIVNAEYDNLYRGVSQRKVRR